MAQVHAGMFHYFLTLLCYHAISFNYIKITLMNGASSLSEISSLNFITHYMMSDI